MIAITEKVLVSQSVSRFLQGSCQGDILLSTSRGVYLTFPGQILMLTDALWGVTPIGIGLADFAGTVSRLGLQAGQPVSLYAGQLTFLGGILRLEIQAFTQAASPFIPLADRITSAAVQLWQLHNPKGAAGLCRPLLLDRDAPLTPLCQGALPPLKQLLQALWGSHRFNAGQAVSQLVGLGIGLTPSMDDVLLGMLYALLRWGDDRASLLIESIRSLAPNGTHPISVAYLLAVAEGAPFQRLDDILWALTAQIPLDLQPIMEIGSSSGSEMLLGLLLAAKLHTQTGDNTSWNILN